MPLGEGYTAEEQLSGEAVHGGIQLMVYPMKETRYRELFEQAEEMYSGRIRFSRSARLVVMESSEMGLAPGGLMRQSINKDIYGIDAWDQGQGLRCFVHLLNSQQYHQVTGSHPPHQPPSAKKYTQEGLPWFDYYDEGEALPGSPKLRKVVSMANKMFTVGKGLLTANEPVEPKIVHISHHKI